MVYPEKAYSGLEVMGYPKKCNTWQIEEFVAAVKNLKLPAGTSVHFLEYDVISGVHGSRNTWHHWFDNGHALACDVNLNGTNDQTEFAWLKNQVLPLAKQYGLAVTFPADTNGYGIAGHSIGDSLHLHVDCGEWSNVGSGAVRASWTKALSSKPSNAGSDDGVVDDGDRGAAVKRVQRIVGVNDDGVFGPKTKAAVEKWQRAHGLNDDGEWGPKTDAHYRGYISKVHGAFVLPPGHYYGVNDGTNRSHSGVRAGDVARVKQIQHSVGVKADGKFGPATAKEVRDWQRSHKLVADGKVGVRTWMSFFHANK